MAFYTIGIQQFVGAVKSQDLLGCGLKPGATCNCWVLSGLNRQGQNGCPKRNDQEKTDNPGGAVV